MASRIKRHSSKAVAVIGVSAMLLMGAIPAAQATTVTAPAGKKMADNALDSDHAPQRVNLTNIGNQILSAYADGDIKKGMSYKDSMKAIGEISVEKTGLNYGMVYNEKYPSAFSLCAWDGNKSEAVAYKSISGDFSPMLINCDFDNMTPLEVTPTENPVVAKRPATSDLDFKDMPNRSETTQEPAQQTAPAEPVKPKEPVEIPWNIILVLLAVPISLAIIFGLFVGIKKFRKSAKKSKITENENIRKWTVAFEQHDNIKKEWTKYQMDIGSLLDNPFLSDLREEKTATFHSALRKSNSLRPENIKSVSLNDPTEMAYYKSVHSLEDAYENAKLEARRVKMSNFSESERESLLRAKKLFNMAMNESSSENERQVAYKRMLSEVDGLVYIPSKTLVSLEEKVKLAITSKSDVED